MLASCWPARRWLWYWSLRWCARFGCGGRSKCCSGACWPSGDRTRTGNGLWLLTVCTLLVSLVGCESEGERVAVVAREAAQRQADQNKQMAQLQGQVAEGSRQLVEAEAKARADMTALQRDLQQSQTEVGRQRDQLEAERRQIAAERYWDGIIGNSITAAATLLACILPLLLCWAVLRRPCQDQEADVALAEFLTQELVSERPTLLPESQPRRLPEPTRRHPGHAPETPDAQQPVSD